VDHDLVTRLSAQDRAQDAEGGVMLSAFGEGGVGVGAVDSLEVLAAHRLVGGLDKDLLVDRHVSEWVWV